MPNGFRAIPSRKLSSLSTSLFFERFNSRAARELTRKRQSAALTDRAAEKGNQLRHLACQAAAAARKDATDGCTQRALRLANNYSKLFFLINMLIICTYNLASIFLASLSRRTAWQQRHKGNFCGRARCEMGKFSRGANLFVACKLAVACLLAR